MAYTTVDNPDLYFQTKLYTANQTDGTAITLDGSEDMSPNMCWWKNRDATYDHRIIDTVRGVTKILTPNTTAAEATNSDALASLGQGSGTEPIPSGPTASAPEPTPSDPTASGFESPVSSLLSGSTRTYAPPGSPSSRVFAAPGDPGSLVARVGVQQEVAAAGFTSPYADQSIRLAPAGIVPRFKEAVSAGTLQQSANIQRFGAIYNLLAGDEEAAQSKLNRA